MCKLQKQPAGTVYMIDAQFPKTAADGYYPWRGGYKPHQLVFEHAEASEEIDGVEQDAVGLASDGGVLHPHLHLRDANLSCIVLTAH